MTTRSAPTAGSNRPERSRRYDAGEIKALKTRDNSTNFLYLALVYAIIITTAVGGVWAIQSAVWGGLSWWIAGPLTALAIVIMGASQHQLGGAIHEGTHYMLFAGRLQNELVSDWLAAFPIYTSTHHFRLHHLSHHQFVNDPDRDPNFAQAKDSGHWLDFPLTHVEMLWGFLRLLWPPNLISYTVARARYSALGLGTNPYVDPARPGSQLPAVVGILFAVGAPVVLITMLLLQAGWGLTLGALVVMWAVAVAYFALVPEDRFPGTRVEPVISHRTTSIGRISYMALTYGALTVVELMGGFGAWGYFALLWILPLFTTFPVFMILREWFQHGNADRGRLTNSRIFLTGPLMRYAVFPWGMDYHLPHHLYASVPHYKLKQLHELLLQDPEYAEKGVVVEGYFGPANPATGRPTAVGILHVDHAPKVRAPAHVDSSVLEHADVSDRAGIERQEQESLRTW